jgi:hypothetical protein
MPMALRQSGHATPLWLRGELGEGVGFRTSRLVTR